jgi:hypothetical protein
MPGQWTGPGGRGICDDVPVSNGGWRGRVVAGLILVGLFGFGTAACSASGPSAAAKVRTTWLSHRYDSVLISTPSPWHVNRNTDCVPNEHPGALVLGVPTGPGTCVDQVGPLGTVVKLSNSSPSALLTLPPPTSHAVIHVHGMLVQSTSYSSGVTIWLVPAAGVEITSRGPNARIVLATLRRA